MTLAQAIREAFQKQDGNQANEVAEFCYLKGWTYDRMMEMVRAARVDPIEWEHLLQEVSVR